ncbi:glycosyltransferase family 32 protein [Laetiporus sulphureus 93-53]|uniref:Glycosyltransferase family 32 protein n=1 Tax=Laetiporus sulphureus 93-53 TaxID=1314785 RepID=A0A165BKN4_9APHY|nr:glycosyltransferase family 32 protein [Laetiporus sulphureus 93-53]KZT01229.1 glycosyltransferase family 32 protein [Laetiporus sulphureus 93-53]
MSRGEYSRLPLYALSEPTPNPQSLSEEPGSPRQHFVDDPAHSAHRWRRIWFSVRYNALRPRTLLLLLKIAVPCAILLALSTLLIWEPHVELAFYSRDWIQSEIEPVLPLGGCFNADRISPRYNISKAIYGPKHTEVHTGIPTRLGMDCYDFAGTINDEAVEAARAPASGEGDTRTVFHTYWRTDLAMFGQRQEWLLKSYFATQDLTATRLVLWSNGDLTGNSILKKWLRRYPDAFELRVVDYNELATDTELEGSSLLDAKDSRAWIDGDLVRLLVLWAYGGVWVDMDSLLTRDLAPLLEHEFVTQWDCYDKAYFPFNGALMRFRQHSPYLCEAFHIMATSQPPRTGSTDWGALLYVKLWRRLVAASIPPFKILPWCFTDGRSCRLDNRLPDAFVADPKNGKWTMGLGREVGGGLDKALSRVFSVHLHNQWEKAFPAGGWVERLLLKRYDEKLALKRDSGDL